MSDVATVGRPRVTNSFSRHWREPEFARHLPENLREGGNIDLPLSIVKLVFNELGRRTNLLAKAKLGRDNLTDEEQLAMFEELVEQAGGVYEILDLPLGAGGTRTVDPIEKAARALIERDFRPIFDRQGIVVTGTDGTKVLRDAVTRAWNDPDYRAKYTALVNNSAGDDSLAALINA